MKPLSEMTREEIEALPAGGELNKLIAIHVRGLHCGKIGTAFEFYCFPAPIIKPDPDDSDTWIYKDSGEEVHPQDLMVPISKYSTDHNHAFTHVVEAMRERGFLSYMEGYMKEYQFGFYSGDKNCDFHFQSKSLPHAICIAALLAIKEGSE